MILAFLKEHCKEYCYEYSCTFHLVNTYIYISPGINLLVRIAPILGICAYFVDFNKIVFYSDCTN